MAIILEIRKTLLKQVLKVTGKNTRHKTDKKSKMGIESVIRYNSMR